MMCPIIREVAVILLFSCIANSSMAQDPGPKDKLSIEKKTEVKPFRILTNGKRITIQSDKDINRVIVWTSSGNRFIEQSNIETPSYNFTIPSKERFVFIMLELQGGKRFTEKIGVR